MNVEYGEAKHRTRRITREKQAESLLHIACTSLNKKLVRALVQQGVRGDEFDEVGNTPLHILVKIFDRDPLLCGEILEILLGFTTINPDAKNLSGWSPIHFAAKKSNSNTLLWILDYNHRSLRQFDIELPGGEENWTPLHISAYLGHVKNVEILLRENASPLLLTTDRRKPRDLTRRKGALHRVLLRAEQRLFRSMICEESNLNESNQFKDPSLITTERLTDCSIREKLKETKDSSLISNWNNGPNLSKVNLHLKPEVKKSCCRSPINASLESEKLLSQDLKLWERYRALYNLVLIISRSASKVPKLLNDICLGSNRALQVDVIHSLTRRKHSNLLKVLDLLPRNSVVAEEEILSSSYYIRTKVNNSSTSRIDPLNSIIITKDVFQIFRNPDLYK